jgi:hypothetical protein
MLIIWKQQFTLRYSILFIAEADLRRIPPEYRDSWEFPSFFLCDIMFRMWLCIPYYKVR